MSDEEISSPFSQLPEGCISHIISLTSPKDACRISSVSTCFKLAAESEITWACLLPPDIQDILARSISPVEYFTKRDLFFTLCRCPILLDQGNLSFQLSKSSGKKCYMLSAKNLHITWIDKYWKWFTSPDSRFGEVAELSNVCWLEIRGTIQSQFLSPETNYAAYLVFKIDENASGLEYVSKASINFVKDGFVEVEGEVNRVYFAQSCTARIWREHIWEEETVTNSDGWLPQTRPDGWMEIKLGEFFHGKGFEDGDVEMQLLEIESGSWKSGLIVEGVELRPVQAF